MALEGSVKDFGVVDIFQLIAMQKKAGALTLSRDDKTVRVLFVNGNIVNAFEGDESERLSNALMTAEKITMIQLRAALRIFEKDVPIGETFVKLAYLTPQEVKEWNQTLTQETIFDLLSWETGSYRFDPEDITLRSDHYSPISVERILMEGMRQKDEWPALIKKVPSKAMVFELIEKPKEDVDSFSPQYETNGEETGPIAELFTTEEHAWLLKWIDGVKTVEDIVNHAGVGAFPIYKCLVELLAEGRIRQREVKPGVKEKRNFLQSLKNIALNPTLLNNLILGVVLIALTTLFIPSFYGVNSVFQKIGTSVKEFREFTALNEKDVIVYSLNLYYLKHNRFPNTLYELKSDGLINTRREKEIDIGAFLYRSDGVTYQIAPIDR